MSNDYTGAIQKLRALVDDNEALCVGLEKGDITVSGFKDATSLISTYRYWGQCCCIAAWLLEQEQTKGT